MAALANLSAYFKYLSPLVCQKLLGLLEVDKYYLIYMHNFFLISKICLHDI